MAAHQVKLQLACLVRGDELVFETAETGRYAISDLTFGNQLLDGGL